MNDLTGGVDVLKDGSEGEFSKLVTVFKMSHGKLIEAETNAIESKKKLDLLDKEGKELDVDLGKLRLKLKSFEANKVVVMEKLRSAKKRKVVAAQKALGKAEAEMAKAGADADTNSKFVVEAAKATLKEANEEVRVLGSNLDNINTEANRAGIDISNLEGRRAKVVEEVKELQSVHSENVHQHAVHALKHGEDCRGSERA